MCRYFRYLALIICVLAAQGVRAAAPEVTARISPDSIMIGDHFTLDVTVTKDIMQVVEFPVFNDGKFGETIEILQEFATDTLSADGRRLTLTKQYLMTSFDAGRYTIDGFPMLYMDKNIVDTLLSKDTLRLSVGTFPIDTVQNTIYDIKRPELAPRLVSEVSGYFITGLVALAVLAAVIIVVLRAMARRRANGGTSSDKSGPRELPQERAIRELEALHNQKVWQNNKHKLYYSRLSDILRTYLDGRYGVGAMEMTTDEIMTALESDLSEKNYTGLCEILRTADLVKFAKLTPDGDLNDSLYYRAYYFVEDTKELPEEEVGKCKSAQEDANE